MVNEEISKIVEASIALDDLKQLNKTDFWIDQVKALLNLIPIAGGFLAQEVQNVQTYHDSEFFRKYTCFILDLKDTSKEERENFIKEIADKSNDYPGNVLANIVDSLDNINKEKILAKLTIAKIHNKISIDDFFRLSTLLERIPYVDLGYLQKYMQSYYDESGDSELLYSTGALTQAVIGPDGDRYVLSRLGRMLLKYGLDSDVQIEVPFLFKEIYPTSGVGAEDTDLLLEDIELPQSQFERDLLRGK